MNKSELIEVWRKKWIVKKDAEKALNAFTESVQEALVNGEKVQLVGFGGFEVRRQKERAKSKD